MADAVHNWAPYGNPIQTKFKLQGEYMRRKESGTLAVGRADRLAPGPAGDAGVFARTEPFDAILSSVTRARSDARRAPARRGFYWARTGTIVPGQTRSGSLSLKFC